MIPYKTDLVQVNKFSRPGIKLVQVLGLVLHWTGNKGSSDENHAEYFDGPDGGGERYASAHFFVDRDSATLIIPLDEVAYHANDLTCKIPKLKASAPNYKGGNANLTTIGIEMCVEKDGTIHPETIARTVQLTSHLCEFYKLTTNDIYRHYDVTGKNCPAPWVKDGQLFVDFKNKVNDQLNPKPKVTTASTSPYKANGVIRWIETGGYAGQALLDVHTHLTTIGYSFKAKTNSDLSLSFLIGPFDVGTESYAKCKYYFDQNKHFNKLLTREEAAEWK